jgi:hypothetical protein
MVSVAATSVAVGETEAEKGGGAGGGGEEEGTKAPNGHGVDTQVDGRIDTDSNTDTRVAHVGGMTGSEAGSNRGVGLDVVGDASGRNEPVNGDGDAAVDVRNSDGAYDVDSVNGVKDHTGQSREEDSGCRGTESGPTSAR